MFGIEESLDVNLFWSYFEQFIVDKESLVFGLEQFENKVFDHLEILQILDTLENRVIRILPL